MNKLLSYEGIVTFLKTLKSLFDKKQDKLVSGITIKTINGKPILGSGDIALKTSLDLSTINIGATAVTGDIGVVVKANGSDLTFNFTVPQGEQGELGELGTQGPVVYPAGEYSNSTSYTADTSKAPYILDPSDNNYYVLNKQTTWLGTEHSNISPSEDTTGSWILFENYEAIYAKIGIIKNGLIGGAVFNDDYMFSLQGIDKSGTSTTAYENFNSSAPYGSSATFKPNWCVNFATGLMWTSAGKCVFNANGSGSVGNGALTWDSNGDYFCKLDPTCISDLEENFITTSSLNTTLEDYISAETLDQKGFIDTDTLDNAIGNFVTGVEAQLIAANVITNQKCITESALEEKGYVTSSDLESKNYVDSDTLTTKLADYVTESATTEIVKETALDCIAIDESSMKLDDGLIHIKSTSGVTNIYLFVNTYSSNSFRTICNDSSSAMTVYYSIESQPTTGIVTATEAPYKSFTCPALSCSSALIAMPYGFALILVVTKNDTAWVFITPIGYSNLAQS